MAGLVETVERLLPSVYQTVVCRLRPAESVRRQLIVLVSRDIVLEPSVWWIFGPQRTKWRCLVKEGIVADATSISDEGAM